MLGPVMVSAAPITSDDVEDDGFEVKMHLGLVETERAKDKRQYLIVSALMTRNIFTNKKGVAVDGCSWR